MKFSIINHDNTRGWSSESITAGKCFIFNFANSTPWLEKKKKKRVIKVLSDCSFRNLNTSQVEQPNPVVSGGMRHRLLQWRPWFESHGRRV